MRFKSVNKTIATLALAGAVSQASAAFIDTGWAETSNWEGLINSNFSFVTGGFDGFSPAAVWQSGLAPTSGWNSLTPTNDAAYIAAAKPVQLIKQVGNKGYAGNSGIYMFEASTLNFEVEAGLGADWETLVFQSQVIESGDPAVAPVLNINGGAQGLAATFSNLLFRGDVYVDAIGDTADVAEIAYQWDLTGYDLSNGFTISVGFAGHDTLVGAQLSGSDVYAQVVPELSTWAMISGALVLGVVALRRRRK